MAGIQDHIKFPFLSGHVVEFKDGGLKVKTEVNPPGTESILLMGTSVDGPKNVPVEVDPTTAELIFGKEAFANGQPNGSTLLVGFNESYGAGARDLRLMRISGENAVGVIKATAQTVASQQIGEEIMGVVNGNSDTTFDLSQTKVDHATVRVFVKGVEIANVASTQFIVTTETNGAEKVTVNAGIADAKADVTISYQIDTGAHFTDVGTTDAAGVLTPFELAGANQTFTLKFAPQTLVVSVNGKRVDAAFISVAGKVVTVKPGAAAKDSILNASYSYVNTNLIEPKLDAESVFPGSLYNAVKFKVDNVLTPAGVVVGKKVIITKPAVKKTALSEKALEYSSIDFPTLADIEEAVNGDRRNNVIRFSVANQFADIPTNTLLVTPESVLTGGNDGIKMTKEETYAKLSGERDADGALVKPGSFQLLEQYATDYVVPLGVFADDHLVGGKNFAYDLALNCAVMSHLNHVTHGVIATTSADLPTLEAVADHVEYLATQVNMDFFMKDADGLEIADAEGNKIALGQFLSVVAGPDVRLTNPRFGTYAANSAAVYAGMLSALPIKSSPLNKDVPGIAGVRYTLGNAHLNALVGARFVTYEVKDAGRGNKRIVVADGVTAAAPGSDYAQVTAFRAVKAAADEVRAASDPFLGENNDAANRNAMSSAIEKRLQGMKDAGAIQGFEFRIISTLADQVLGAAKIELTVVPPIVLKKITTVISLAPSL